MPSSGKTTIVSAFLTVDNLWTTTIVVRVLESSSKDSWISCSVILSKADVASSSIKIGGFFKKILPIAILCFWPPESFTPLSPTSVL